MSTVTLTAENFGSTIESSDTVLIDFWAAWCGPCRQFGPVFEAASEANPDIVFGKVDTEAEQQLAAQFAITSIPTLMVFRDGVMLYGEPGALRKDNLDRLIEEVRKVDMDDVRQKIAAQKGGTPA